jgi:hypothetical protein
VNASSDTFSDPVHVNYSTYKERMVDYIETPDYLKPSMPPIVGKNEYVDFIDVLEATEDLLDTIPNLSNSIDLIKSSPYFKNSNAFLFDMIKETLMVYDPSIETLEAFLKPYVDGGVNNMAYFLEYHKIAVSIRDVIQDNVQLRDMGRRIETINWDRTVVIDGITYTIGELFDRVASATITPDGRYEFTIIEDVSQPGNELPTGVDVDDVADVLANGFSVSKNIKTPVDVNGVIVNREVNVWYRFNTVLSNKGFKMIGWPKANVEYKTSDGINPCLLIDKDNPMVNILVNDPSSRDIISPKAELRVTEADPNVVLDIQTTVILDKAAEMNIQPMDLKNGYDKPITTIKGRTEAMISCAEIGVMFIFAIITLVLAFVYK